jgi:hypothetical protein
MHGRETPSSLHIDQPGNGPGRDPCGSTEGGIQVGKGLTFVIAYPVDQLRYSQEAISLPIQDCLRPPGSSTEFAAVSLH